MTDETERPDYMKDWTDADFISEAERRVQQMIHSHNPIPYEWARVFALARLGVVKTNET